MSRQIIVILIFISIIGFGNLANVTSEEDTDLNEVEVTKISALNQTNRLISFIERQLSDINPYSQNWVRSTVQCYSCVNCPRIKDENKICAYSLEPLKMARCVTYVEKYPHYQNGKNLSWTIRGCVSERGSCNEIRRAYPSFRQDLIQLESCKECVGDKCNSVSRSLPDLVFAFFAIILTPILTRCILS